MRKCHYLIILFFAGGVFAAQNGYATIQGKVGYVDQHGESGPVTRAGVLLKINDSVIMKEITAEDGSYSFRIRKFNGNVKIFVETTKTTSKTKKGCGFIENRDVGLVEFSNSDIYIKDFSLTPYLHCGPPPPEILFRINSCEPYWNTAKRASYDMPPDTAIEYLFSLMKNNPAIVIEISGHADRKEKCRDDLALQRAVTIRNKLLQSGIDAARVEPKGYGAAMMRISEEQIKKAKTRSDREELRQKNRRITFKITRFDYSK